jgi:FRG domain
MSADSDTDGSLRTEPLKVVRVDSWNDFRDEVNAVVGEVFGGTFAFRGQPDSEYELTSSFDRRYGPLSPMQRARTQRRLEDLFQDIAARSAIATPKDAVAGMCLGQHFGLATRMLDWTESRYIAAFFAFSSLLLRYSSSLDAEAARDSRRVSVFAIRKSSPLWSHETVEILSLGYAAAVDNDRLKRQRGLFTVNRTQHTSIEHFVQSYMEENPAEVDVTPLYRFDIPVGEARKAIRDLHDMRISHSELFPGLEGVAMEAMLAEWLGEISAASG